MAIRNPVQNAVKMGVPVVLQNVSEGNCSKFIIVDDLTGDGVQDFLQVGIDIPPADIARESGTERVRLQHICPYGQRYRTYLHLINGVQNTDGSISFGRHRIELYSRAPLNWYRHGSGMFPPAIADVNVADRNGDGVMDIAFHTLVGHGQRYQQMVMYGKPTQKISGITELYRDIDRLDGQQDGHYMTRINLLSYGIYDACQTAEVINEEMARQGVVLPSSRIVTRAHLVDGREVEVSCADHVKNLRTLVEALKKASPYANAAIAEALAPYVSNLNESTYNTAFQRMPDADMSLYMTTNIMDAVLTHYITGREDSKTPPWQAIEKNVNDLIAGNESCPYPPASWLTSGRLDKTKMLRGMMDVLFTLGIDPAGLIPAAYRTSYTPKRLDAILRRRTLPRPELQM